MLTDCLVVFDIDDTLYLERDYVSSGFAAVDEWAQQTLRVDGVAAMARRVADAGARADVFDRVFSRLGVPSRFVADAVTVYREHVPAIGLLTDARHALVEAAGRGGVAVISDGPLASQAAKARALELARWARPICLTAAVGPAFAKPSPLPFEHVRSAWGVPARACVYVGDNPHKDFAAPFAAGWVTIRVRRPGGLHESAEGGPDIHRTVDDLAGLADVYADVRRGLSTSAPRSR